MTSNSQNLITNPGGRNRTLAAIAVIVLVAALLMLSSTTAPLYPSVRKSGQRSE